MFFITLDTDIPRDFMADVIFIMDSSADVSRADYEKEKDFIESLAGYLRLSTGRTRAAVLTYGYTTTLVAEYDSYETLQTFNSAVDGASYIGGTVVLLRVTSYLLAVSLNALRSKFSFRKKPQYVNLFFATRQ